MRKEVTTIAAGGMERGLVNLGFEIHPGKDKRRV